MVAFCTDSAPKYTELCIINDRSVSKMAAPMAKQCLRCFFCNKEEAPYTCPKCNIAYCSVSCYRNPKHNQCSEAFYKDWVQTHLRSADNSIERKREILEILEKQRRKDEEIDSEDDFEERFSRLDFDDANLDGDVIWSLLNEREREEFRNVVERGEAERLVPSYEPFWTFKEEVQLVMEVGSDDKLNLKSCPPVVEHIPELEFLTKVIPSKTLKYNVLNVMYAYAFVSRFYNGDHLEFPLESTEFILHISETLTKNVNWKNTEEAVIGAIRQVRECREISTERPLALKVISDLKLIVEGPSKAKQTVYVLAALSDLRKLVENTRKLLTKTRDFDSPKRSVVDVERHQLNLVKKKLDYYISWSNDRYAELEVVIPELDLVHGKPISQQSESESEMNRVLDPSILASLTVDSEIFEEQRKSVEMYPRKSPTTKPTIEEIK